MATGWSLGSPNSRSGYLAWASTKAQLIPNRNPLASFWGSSVRPGLLLWALSPAAHFWTLLAGTSWFLWADCSLSGMNHLAAIPTTLQSPEHAPQGGCASARPLPWTVALSSDPPASSRVHQLLLQLTVESPASTSNLLFPLQTSKLFSLLEEGWGRKDEERDLLSLFAFS